MPPVLLDAHQLADKLDARYDDVLCWARLGTIPSIKAGGRYYFDLRRVAKALNERATEADEVACAGASTT